MRIWSQPPRVIRGVVLAAGRGTRFGGAKLAVIFRGRPLLAHTVSVVAESCHRGLLSGGVVVVPAGDPDLAVIAEAAELTTITQPKPSAGIASSLRLALDALDETDTDAAMIFLGDQPLVRVETVAAVIEASQRNPAAIVRPVYQEQPTTPGHPVIVPAACWPLLRGDEGDRGFAVLAATHPSVVTVPVTGANPDVDRAEDLAALTTDSIGAA